MLHLSDGLGHLVQVVLYRLRVKTPAHLREVLPLNEFPFEFQVAALLDGVEEQRKPGPILNPLLMRGFSENGEGSEPRLLGVGGQRCRALAG